MLPEAPPWMLAGIAELVLEQTQSTKTYCLDKDSQSIAGYIDEKQALEQMVYLALSTEKDAWAIYPTFGDECRNLIGKPVDFAMAEIPRLVREALINDDRVDDVDSFVFEVERDKIVARFVVRSIYGNSELETEVPI